MTVCSDCYRKLCDRIRGEVHSPAVLDPISHRVAHEFDEVYSAVADLVHKEVNEDYLRDFLSDCVLDVQPDELERAVEIAKVISFDTRMDTVRARRLEEALQVEINCRIEAELATLDCGHPPDVPAHSARVRLVRPKKANPSAHGGSRTHTTISGQRILSP